MTLPVSHYRSILSYCDHWPITPKASTYCILKSIGHIHQETLSKNGLRLDQHIFQSSKDMVYMGHPLHYKDGNDHKDLKVEPRYFVSFWNL